MKDIGKQQQWGPQRLYFSTFVFLFFLIVTACAPLHRDKSTLPEQQLSVALEALTLYQNHYVEEVNSQFLAQNMIDGMLILIENQARHLSAESQKKIQQITKEISPNAPFISVIATFLVIKKESGDAVDQQSLVYAAISNMQKNADPEGAFHPAEENRAIEGPNQELGSVGLQIKLKNQYPAVVVAIEGSPAALSGLQAEDQILSIDDQSATNMSLQEATSKLRGALGTPVKLKIMRTGKEPFEVAIIREKVLLRHLSSKRLPEDIGYIRIETFGETTKQELKIALNRLEESKITALILDLRNNPGGLLNEAISVSELFVNNGQLIAYTSGRSKGMSRSYIAEKQGIWSEIPIVVIVNNASAAASEIVAGALQDSGRATILGTVTFGRGSIQSAVPLRDGSQLRITTSRIFTPKGHTIQGKGIIPDIKVDEPLSESAAVSGTANNSGKIGDINSDVQLRRAIELLRGQVSEAFQSVVAPLEDISHEQAIKRMSASMHLSELWSESLLMQFQEAKLFNPERNPYFDCIYNQIAGDFITTLITPILKKYYTKEEANQISTVLDTDFGKKLIGQLAISQKGPDSGLSFTAADEKVLDLFTPQELENFKRLFSRLATLNTELSKAIGEAAPKIAKPCLKHR